MYGGVARGCMSCTCMAEWLGAGNVMHMYGGVARGCMSCTCMAEWLGAGNVMHMYGGVARGWQCHAHVWRSG